MKEQFREELIAYDKWLTRRKWGTGEIISPEKAADLYLAEHPLPPAEGAEEILHKYVHTINSDGTSLVTFMGALKAMREFAAQQQPTAEGAEEIIDDAETILHSHPYLKVWTETLFDSEMKVCSIEQALWAIEKAATLHAQKIADKMVEEMRQKLFSMRASKETMDMLSEADRLITYGYHDCINEMLMWTKGIEK